MRFGPSQLSCLGSSVVENSVECRGFESYPRQLIFLRKECLLCCFALFVCLTLLASFFLPSHFSLKHMYMYTCKLESGLWTRDYRQGNTDVLAGADLWAAQSECPAAADSVWAPGLLTHCSETETSTAPHCPIWGRGGGQKNT